jgi:C-terminal processing protease CtpA/Prc
MINTRFMALLLLIAVCIAAVGAVAAQEEAPEAEIINNEGGAVLVTGEMDYTNPLLTAGVAQPLIILEDQTGYVRRDRQYLFPEESQTLGQFTSDFFSSPVSYSIALPIEPQGALNDVDNDDDEDTGVQIFAVAYWTNTFGDPFLERRDQQGGGWSTAYASTQVDASTSEVEGGKYLIYAPEEGQGFPSGFGDDGLLFTEDDPIVIVPQGYTVVDLDSDPFTFDRSREVEIDTIEPQETALDDFSSLSYTEAFDAMIEKFRSEYAFSEYKDLDWNAISDEFRPRFEEAEENNDPTAYAFALRDFTWAIPDGHVGAGIPSIALDEAFLTATAGGLGLSLVELDDGRVLVNFILPGGPAAEAGIALGAEITEINGTPIADAISETQPFSLPFSTEHALRLQQLRYVVRFPLDSEVELTYANEGEEATTAALTTVDERQSFGFSSFNRSVTGAEPPVTYEILPSGYGYVKIWSFFDNEVLTIQLWEAFISLANQGLPGVIIDMRQNGGGSGFLAEQMAAYFFDEEQITGYTGFYDPDTDAFVTDLERPDRMYPPPPELRYGGPVAVLVGPACASACEFFSYNMTLDDRAEIVGQYPTAGLGGSVEDFYMPDGASVRITIGRALDADEEIHIEGIGVVPTIDVPVDEETAFAQDDVVLAYAERALDEITGQVGTGNAPPVDVTVTDGGEIAVGDEVSGELLLGERIRYTLTVEADGALDIAVAGSEEDLDTYLRIYDAEDALLTENDDVVLGEQINSAVTGLEVAEGDVIVIEVGTFDDVGAGTFTMTVTAAE